MHPDDMRGYWQATINALRGIEEAIREQNRILSATNGTTIDQAIRDHLAASGPQSLESCAREVWRQVQGINTIADARNAVIGWLMGKPEEIESSLGQSTYPHIWLEGEEGPPTDEEWEQIQKTLKKNEWRCPVCGKDLDHCEMINADDEE